jgi:hypothetical protein
MLVCGIRECDIVQARILGYYNYMYQSQAKQFKGGTLFQDLPLLLQVQVSARGAVATG